MHIERLKLMSTMLREVAAGTWTPTRLPNIAYATQVIKEDGLYFDLENWAEVREGNFGTHCGYSACAVGHAGLDARFDLALTFDNEGEFAHPILTTNVGDTTGWPAVRRYFGLEDNDATYLFSEYAYLEANLPATDPGAVADRIDAFIAGKE